jgi:TetR/AcrR family transcriptional repressor of nem operon
MSAATEPASRTPTTADKALDIAERLAQTRGFNGFSYADIAAELHITKASLHYHFASKAELGRALITRYTDAFQKALATIQGGAQDRLRRYVQLYETVLVRDRMCLCGMLAAEYSTLPTPMKDELRRFFDLNDAWLTSALDQGRSAGEIAFDGSGLEAARTLTAGLEGAMLLARSYEEPGRFAVAAQRLLAQVGVSRPAGDSTAPTRRAAATNKRRA